MIYMFRMFSGNTPETNIYEIALKDEAKLCRKLADVTNRYRRNNCTYGELDQARADLINHLIFMRELEGSLLDQQNRR